MSHPFSRLRLFARLTIAMPILASATLLLSTGAISQADAPQPNVAVYQIDPTHGDDWLHSFTQQIGLYAPGNPSPAFVIPAGRYVTPNGHFAIGMSAAGTYPVFNLQTGSQVATLTDSTGAQTPTSMAVSPNGTYAAVSSTATASPNNWSITLFNLTSNTRYTFSGTASTAPAGSAPSFQLQPAIVGWTGDESALILATNIPSSSASTHLFFKMAMSGIAFTPTATAGTPIPPIIALGADQPITQLIFSPDSARAAFLYQDTANAAVNFTAISTATPLSPNGLKVIDLTSGVVTPIASAAPGQGLTAPAWAADGSKLYFGSGPFQSTPYPVNVHLISYDFTSHTLTAGDALVASDPAHIGISDMQVCVDQVFMRELTIVPALGAPVGTSVLSSKITSAPMSALGTHTDVYITQANGLGPCVPAVTGGSTGGSTGGGVVPSIPTVSGGVTVIVVTATTAPTATSAGTATPSGPIACILAPHLMIGGQGIVTAGTPNNIRSTPTINSSLLGQIPAGQTFNVLGGPFCDTTSGYVYWQISYNGTTGYTAEGKTTYLVTPYTPTTTTGVPTGLTSATVTPTLGTLSTLIPGTCINGFVWREARPGDIVCVTPDVRSQTAADNAAASSRVVPNGTCVNGYVWREARPGDLVCVTPDVRSQAAADNAAASSRVNPTGPYGPNTCVNGYVWRDAYPGDVVCVTSDVRSQAAADNAAASSRVVPNGTCINGYVWREAYPGDIVCVTPDVRTQAAADNAAASSRVAH